MRNLILATEGPLLEHVPADHIAAKLAIPLAILFFCGSVYVLLWAIYGAKKGALVYLTAFFGFTFLLGVYWWFGAPGTPVATGLVNFPGQPGDNYQGQWFPFEPGSERAEFFPISNEGLDSFQTVAEYVGQGGTPIGELEGDPNFSFISGDLSQGLNTMLAQFLPTDEQGTALIGPERRARIEEAFAEQAGELPDDRERASPFLTAQVATDDDGRALVRLTDSNGHRVAAARLQLLANTVNADENVAPERETFVVEERTWYAFKDPGALWFPSAVWTVVSLVLFALSLFGLDRMEQREKAVAAAAAEAEQPGEAREPVNA
ncbi:MAG: hypothetical protein KY469_17215 [Actinobacteria bacterium]|nr:hypothetical protein [Actinomycetota bacterium]